MKKGLLLVLLLLLFTLSSCGERAKLFKDFDTEYETPEHYVIGYGTETHFEMGMLEPDVVMVYHNGQIHYEFNNYVYIPKDDGTYDVVDMQNRPRMAYNLGLDFEFEELAISDFDYLLEGKRYFKSIISTKFRYEDEDVEIIIYDYEYDSLRYEIVYPGQEIMHSVQTIDEDDYQIPVYELDTTTGNIFSKDYTLDVIENDDMRYNIYVNGVRMAIDFEAHIVNFYIGDTIQYDFSDKSLTNLTRDEYYNNGRIWFYYGDDDKLFIKLDEMYLIYRTIILGEKIED